MLKKITVVTSSLLLFPPLISPLDSLEDQTYPTTLSDTTKTILHLFYVTERLDPAIQLIKKTISSSKKLERSCSLSLSLFFQETNSLETEKMRVILLQIDETESLQPFFHLWNQIQSFRYGLQPQEEPLILDFAKVCLIAYQALVASTKKEPFSTYRLSNTQVNDLHTLEEVFQNFEKTHLFYGIESSSKDPSESLIKPDQITREELSTCFAFRFYLTKRLDETFSHLLSLAQAKRPIFTNGVSSISITEDEPAFHNSVIKSYFQLLLKGQQCGPLGQLVQQFKSFDYIHDVHFLKEFLLLLCVSYKSLYSNTQSIETNRSISDWYSLTIEQLLNIIDENTKMASSHIPLVKHRSSKKSLEKEIPNNPPFQPTFASISSLINAEYTLHPDAFTDLVFRRYYFINRLNEVITALLKIKHPSKASYVTPYHFSLRPLPLVWKDFSSYRFIIDQEYTPLFINQLIEYSHLSLHANSSDQSTPILTEFLHDKENDATKHQLDLTISANHIIMRFYHLKRLERIMLALHELRITNKLYCSFIELKSKGLFHNSLFEIHNELLRQLLVSLHIQQNIQPLFSFWNGLSKYKYIHDTTILKEFSCLIAHLLTDTLATLCKSSLPLQDFSDMSLEDILNLLDILVEELPQFIEKTELTAPITWSEWLKKYWLIGPLALGIVTLKIFLKNREVWRAHHSLPTPLPCHDTDHQSSVIFTS